MALFEGLTSSQDGQKYLLPHTPKKRTLTLEDQQTPQSQSANKEENETVRRRRGFRPLSVFTPSMFFPFDMETTKAMEDLDYHSALSTPSKVTTQSQQTVPLDCPKRLSGTEPVHMFDHMRDLVNPLSRLTAHGHSETTREIKCSFPGLMFLPAPDPSQHPVFSHDPFGSVSESPSLVSTSTIDEIRRLSTKPRISSSFCSEPYTSPSFGDRSEANNRASKSSEESPSTDRKRLIIPDYIRSPDPILGKRGFSARMEGSPLAGRFREIVIPSQSAVSIDEEEEVDRKRSTAGSLRKLSDLFKSRLSSDKSSTPSSTASYVSENIPIPLVTSRSILEERLRICTYSPTYSYHTSSAFPRHPTTGRNWKSRNLKCTTCSDQSCALCGRACCAYRASVMALDTHRNNPQGRSIALQRIQEITTVYPYGKEAPTFLRCTSTSDIRCQRMICPDCCGQCPDASCKDVQCYKCKSDPWDVCEWHADLSAITHAESRGRGYEGDDSGIEVD